MKDTSPRNPPQSPTQRLFHTTPKIKAVTISPGRLPGLSKLQTALLPLDRSLKRESLGGLCSKEATMRSDDESQPPPPLGDCAGRMEELHAYLYEILTRLVFFEVAQNWNSRVSLVLKPTQYSYFLASLGVTLAFYVHFKTKQREFIPNPQTRPRHSRSIPISPGSRKEPPLNTASDSTTLTPLLLCSFVDYKTPTPQLHSPENRCKFSLTDFSSRHCTGCQVMGKLGCLKGFFVPVKFSQFFSLTASRLPWPSIPCTTATVTYEYLFSGWGGVGLLNLWLLSTV